MNLPRLDGNIRTVKAFIIYAAALCGLGSLAGEPGQPDVRWSIQQAGAVRGCAISPDAMKVATGSATGAVFIYDAATGLVARSIDAHLAAVNQVAFSPDNSMLASTSDDKTLRVWNIADGSLVRSFTNAAGFLWSVVFSRDSKFGRWMFRRMEAPWFRGAERRKIECGCGPPGAAAFGICRVTPPMSGACVFRRMERKWLPPAATRRSSFGMWPPGNLGRFVTPQTRFIRWITVRTARISRPGPGRPRISCVFGMCLILRNSGLCRRTRMQSARSIACASLRAEAVLCMHRKTGR
jgi:hypothetical protein